MATCTVPWPRHYGYDMVRWVRTSRYDAGEGGGSYTDLAMVNLWCHVHALLSELCNSVAVCQEQPERADSPDPGGRCNLDGYW